MRGRNKSPQKILEAQPAMINEPSADGFSLLGYACFFGEPQIAGYLIEKNADVNMPSANAFKVSPLHSACASSDYDLAELLLKHGADVKCQAAIWFYSSPFGGK